MYLAMGMTYSEFMHATPRVLEAYRKAFDIKIKMIDQLAWQIGGNYLLSAVSVAVEHCLAGKKAKSEYIKEPVSKTARAEEGKLSEEELQRQRELFVAKLEVMKTNFELNHKPKKQEASDGNC